MLSIPTREQIFPALIRLFSHDGLTCLYTESSSDFARRFDLPFDAVYGKYFKLLSMLRLIRTRDDEIILTDVGAYWLHALQDIFSIDYVSTLWGTSQHNPWPQAVALS